MKLPGPRVADQRRHSGGSGRIWRDEGGSHSTAMQPNGETAHRMGVKCSSLLAAAAALILMAGCSWTSSNPGAAPTSTATTVSTLGGLNLPHPATWKLGATGEPAGTMGAVLGYLSTDAMH